MDRRKSAVIGRIIEAGLELLEAEGVQGLSQTRIAKRSGLRQSHLTYYFPRIGDLLLAIFDASHRRAAYGAEAASENGLSAMRTVMFDRQRMGFFLRLVADSGANEEFRAALAEHAEGWAVTLAPFFAKDAKNPDLVAFVDYVRGRAIRHLLETRSEAPSYDELLGEARRFSLHPTGGSSRHKSGNVAASPP